MHGFFLIYRYRNPFFRKVYDLGAYDEYTKTNANISFQCKSNFYVPYHKDN